MSEKKRYTSEEVLNLQSQAYQKGLNEGYQLKKQQQPGGAGWVKAIRGMIPDGIHSMKLVSKEDVVMRGTGLVTNNAITVITFLNKSTMGETELPENYEGVYYLDESPAEQPVFDRSQIMRHAIAFANWFLPSGCVANEKDYDLFMMKPEALLAAEQPGREVDDWISVDERLPEEGGRYWCYVEYLTDLGFSYFQWNCDYNPQLRRFSDMTLTKGERITHWRELPEPPKIKKP